MYPLIEIKTVPIELEMKTVNAKLEYARGTADLEISRKDGGLNIRSRAIQLNLDTFEARDSIFPASVGSSISKNAEKGQQAAYEATSVYAQQGQVLLNAKIGQEMVTQFAKDAMTKNLKPNVGIQFLPSVPPEISVTPGEMSIKFEMDKLNFDWRLNQQNFKFTPGDIEISVKQLPDVLIKYVGGPLYVPPSSDPNYVPLDTRG